MAAFRQIAAQRVRSQSDPIERCKARIFDGKHASEDDLKAIDKDIKAIVKEAADFSLESPEPDPSELYTDVLTGAFAAAQ